VHLQAARHISPTVDDPSVLHDDKTCRADALRSGARQRQRIRRPSCLVRRREVPFKTRLVSTAARLDFLSFGSRPARKRARQRDEKCATGRGQRDVPKTVAASQTPWSGGGLTKRVDFEVDPRSRTSAVARPTI
jgi:hypothetical protein